MESLPVGPSLVKQGLGIRTSTSAKDLWTAARCGSIHDVDIALSNIKRINGNINARNALGSTALHIAVWRNHVPIVRRLLTAGSEPDTRDGESGWSSLHRALHFGHLAVAGVLIEAGASLSLEDCKGRTPVDLLSGPIKQVIADVNNIGSSEVFSWGNGANYQLGTGTAGIQKLPCRIDALQGLHVTGVAAAKFHSVAVTKKGELYSWGFGRGGRLGHTDFDIHSGQVAVITPQLVTNGLGSRKVKAIAAAKHHTVITTDNGEVFTWGSNREGQLGYPSVDTQPIPRRVSSFKAKVNAVAAANKHTAVLTEVGEVYTWGYNGEGQLGYGTSNSASNYTPRIVDYLKGKVLVAVSAAKYHTVVLGAEGDVFTWGHKMVMPRRVLVARDTKKAGSVHLKFHRSERLHIAAIAAGVTHSTMISEDGLVFCWSSSDPHLHCYQVLSLAGHQAVAVAAGKYRTAVITASGDLYGWDGEKTKKEAIPVPYRIHGIKHATEVSVAENHSLVIAAVYTPKFPPNSRLDVLSAHGTADEHVDYIEEDLELEDSLLSPDMKQEQYLQNEKQQSHAPSLKEICQRVMAEYVIESKNALQLLEISDLLGADDLRKHCEDVVLHNLDYLLTICPMVFGHVRPALLADLEKALDASSVEQWSFRHLPTPTATFPVILDSEEDDSEVGYGVRTRTVSFTDNTLVDMKRASEGFLRQENELDREVAKQQRALRKKLQQIEALELKQARGHSLDYQQLAKLQTKEAVKEALKTFESTDTSELAASKVEFVPLDISDKNQVTEAGSSRRQQNRCKANNALLLEDLDEKKSKNIKRRNGSTKKSQNGFGAIKGNTGGSTLVKEKGNDGKEDLHCANQLGATSPASAFEESWVNDPHVSSNQGAAGCILTNSCSSSTGSFSHLRESSSKKKNKKGGLSLFLSGGLDNVAKPVTPASILTKVDGPAWGGAQIVKGSASLRDIQNQQIAESRSVPAGSLPAIEEPSKLQRDGPLLSGIHAGSRSLDAVQDTSVYGAHAGNIQVPLSHFVRTSVPTSTLCIDITKDASGSSPPPWAGTSPLSSISSFKDIQMQQVKQKAKQKQCSLQVVPQSGNPVSLHGFLPKDSNAIMENSTDFLAESTNRWFKPETENPSSIRSIQIEEKAMKELRHFYKDVRLVRNQHT